MAHIVTDIEELYKTYFGQPYVVPTAKATTKTTQYGMPLSREMLGREVMLPVTLRGGDMEITLPCCTIRVQGEKSIVRTAMSERVGTVKELWQTDDWQFRIQGVLIADEGRAMPDEQIVTLKRLFELPGSITMENALADLFLDKSDLVCMTSISFPEVQGRNLKHRPFEITLESDYVGSLD